jgi:hypothetical protein
MSPQRFAVIFGIVYVAIGILGFIPRALDPPPPGAPELLLSGLYGYLFRIFPVNWVHSAAHLALGVWGVIAAKRHAAAAQYARSLTAIYGLLFVCGLIPGLRTMFGLMPLFGHDIWLHALTAFVAGYVGFVREAPARSTVR